MYILIKQAIRNESLEASASSMCRFFYQCKMCVNLRTFLLLNAMYNKLMLKFSTVVYDVQILCEVQNKYFKTQNSANIYIKNMKNLQNFKYLFKKNVVSKLIAIKISLQQKYKYTLLNCCSFFEKCKEM